LSDLADIVERLLPFDMVCVMRERTSLSRSVIERLPRLKLIASTGTRNAAIDVEAAAESPVIDVSASALMQLAEWVRAGGHAAVITGEGADELQAGYPWFRIQQRLDRLDRAMLGLPVSVPGVFAHMCG
jgi:asparagine synthetase B (glutamine-hydrolysing)